MTKYLWVHDNKLHTNREVEPSCGIRQKPLDPPCIRVRGHNDLRSLTRHVGCFAILPQAEGSDIGVYMKGKGRIWVRDPNEWPPDIVGLELEIELPKIDRRGAIEHTRSMS